MGLFYGTGIYGLSDSAFIPFLGYLLSELFCKQDVSGIRSALEMNPGTNATFGSSLKVSLIKRLVNSESKI